MAELAKHWRLVASPWLSPLAGGWLWKMPPVKTSKGGLLGLEAAFQCLFQCLSQFLDRSEEIFGAFLEAQAGYHHWD